MNRLTNSSRKGEKGRKPGKYACILAIALVLLTGLSLLPNAYAKEAAKPLPLPKEITFATYPMGSTAYTVASGVAKVVTMHTPISANITPLAGPVIWDSLVNKGQQDGAIADSCPALSRAYKGLDEYTYKHTNLRYLFFTYSLRPINLVVRADSGIKRIGQLKGKRVTGGFVGAKTLENQIECSLASAGLTWDDVIKVPVTDITAGLRALREGRVDAAFGLTATAPITVETDRDIGCYVLPLEPGPRLEKCLNEKSPGCQPSVIPAGEGIVREPTLSFDSPYQCISSTHLSEAAAYEIVKAVWENYKDLQPIHALMRKFNPDKMIMKNPVVPCHDGAIRWYKEKGVWSQKLDAIQKQLLAP